MHVKQLLAQKLIPWQAARHLLAAFRYYSGRGGAIAAAFVTAGALFEGAGLLLLVPIIGVITHAEKHALFEEWFLAMGLNAPSIRLALLVSAFAAVLLLRSVILFARDIQLVRLQTGFVEAQRNQVMQMLAMAPWEEVAQLRHARVMNLMGAEMQRMGNSLHFFIQGCVGVAMLIVQIALAFLLAPALAASAFGILLLGGSVVVLGQVRVHGIGTQVVTAGQDLMNSANSFLGGLKTAAAQGAQAFFITEFAKAQRNVLAGQLRFAKRQASGRLIFGVAAGLVGGAIVFIGFTFFQAQSAVLIALVLIFARMSGPALQVQQAAQNFFFGVAGFDAIKELSNDLTCVKVGETKTEKPVRPDGAITFHQVTFRHASGGGVELVDLEIQPGAMVGISGPSGAGKTTLIDLLVGLITPQHGEIRIGGTLLNAASWQRRIAYVQQDGFLFHDSVRRNLLWHAPDTSTDEIMNMLEMLGARAIVERLPQGLDSIIGERGALLSGGERQRLGLARALISKPTLLVLDEATNAIDRAGEAAILDSLAKLSPRPTIVMVTHREEALTFCNQCIYLEAGHVRQQHI
ncbi:ATP-binding cassette domain-containing protein [Novosphingobium beihaiensis]|uniref:ABC transporter ATP-binding protein/permease n=1 Tax=Novosphingobium beihaiensis TaxID=2930389 RepID=A0ABT0BTW0_9SPHN|nr:ABC transporter ATP-binding protein [Novosphingobium beihaiensis]MCJ2188114.1 ABC transporter ATP-binding protein/permease [Novosphingobium beihaiensis]